jgi:undecaprenyl diphosphate synthase
LAAKDISERSDMHVGVIMDGNGRWATQRGRPRLFGHKAGAERIREIVEACPDLGVRHLTIFAFSTENWKRSTEEVSGLMSIFRRYIQSEAAVLQKNGAKVRFIGDRAQLDKRLFDLIEFLEESTAHNTRVNVTVALNYGSRNEILRAATKIANQIATGALKDPSEDDFDAALDTSGLPDLDLIIRTSGEARLSNFLLWQAAYAEIEFTKTLWPDFTRDEFSEIVERFFHRERRFGAVVG